MIRIVGICCPTDLLSSVPPPVMPGTAKWPLMFTRDAFDFADLSTQDLRHGHGEQEIFPVEQMGLSLHSDGIWIDALADVPRKYVDRFVGLSIGYDDPHIDAENGRFVVHDVLAITHVAFCTKPMRPMFPQTRNIRIEEL